MPQDEFGDFQTPLPLATQCLRVLGLPDDARVLEPTCGRGAFLEAAAALSPASERLGLERHPAYVEEASRWGEVREANVFEVAFGDLPWRTQGPLVVVGNPPWVTSAALARLGSDNLPVKSNRRGARGIDALLGSSNFDVCEYVIEKILTEHRGEPMSLGMLCKTQVARNLLAYAAASGLPVTDSAVYRVDSTRWFGANVDACWLVMRLDPGATPRYVTSVWDDVFAPHATPSRRFGVVDGLLVADVDRYSSVREGDGICPYEWRSGLKHDAAAVFELVAASGPTTRDGRVLEVESEYLLPLLKSTDVFRGRHRELSRWVIVPQRTFGEETASLEQRAPRLWAYLLSHARVLDARRSSIYRNRPRFTVFGHGEYTYAPYKVAVSGLHEQPVFRLVAPLADRPVVLDDTCYFLPFSDPTEAALVTAALNSKGCRDLIESLVFWDAKRPITKRLLSRLDLRRLPHDRDDLLARAAGLAREAGLGWDDEWASGLLRGW
ncbi:class I SAM-dependent methyltransferase [Nocardioides sp. CBS4Y-1]|uniref:Class I SAM-dependent methyltransferase n=1 Tax=Nocardioides acrostichi TaxID=2784339 RepID=A0A930UYW4_9ACTN|nr:class I SAM-dependent methyltransferase [Nocardioides acrostichi]